MCAFNSLGNYTLKHTPSWSDRHVRLKELESRITMCITDEHIVIVNLHRYLLREPENVPDTRWEDG